MVSVDRKDWRELCAEAAEEPDSERVVSLVHQILQALDDCDPIRLLSPDPRLGETVVDSMPPSTG